MTPAQALEAEPSDTARARGKAVPFPRQCAQPLSQPKAGIPAGGEGTERRRDKGRGFAGLAVLFFRTEPPVPACRSRIAELPCSKMFVFISLILPVLF